MATIPDTLTSILGNSPSSLESLVKLWDCRDPRLWQQREELYLECGKRAITLGQPIMAFDILKEGRVYFPQSGPLTYFAALALARGGSTGHAANIVQHLIETLDRKAPLYVEALCLAGRIAKDRWEKSPPGPRKQGFVTRAAAWYQQAYELSDDDYFPGINAATMYTLSGEVAQGRQIARKVYRTCQRRYATTGRNDYWLAATLGEACLLLGEQQEAMRWYNEALQLAGKNVGDIATIRRQVRLLTNVLDRVAAVLEILRIGRVAVFSGHMIDAPGRPIPRFPPELEEDVRAAIAKALERFDIGFGYASAACGSDILFLECLLERGAQAHVTLPFRQEDFLRTSVTFAGAAWVERFHQVLSRATSVRCAVDEVYLGDDILFEYNNVLNMGTALLYAERLGTELVALAVSDASAASEVGGTMAALEAWQRLCGTVEILALETLRKHTGRPLQKRPGRPPVATPAVEKSLGQTRSPHLRREIKTMLFSDMVGFSKLAEESAPSFVVHFLGEVAKVMDSVTCKPAFKNTWGDGLFLVFDDVAVGADFALRLRDTIKRTNWAAVGLPEDTDIRLGLHAGPVFPSMDPIIGQQNFFGSHVNMAARIEPITPPGAVYVSEQFASLLVASGAPGFACDYMGNVALAKGFGVHPIYRLRRAHEIE